ncbi:hypothetical protein [Micromonospora sp. NBC_00898]|uniref:hypothetical protein n=1 Tax=Micromonospora sp. NBC_00898 TaxID=2975981 RepID=UPI00386394DE
MRRAGIGIGTLYRNFPTREDLVEASYLAEVQAVCDYAEELDREDAFAASRAPPGRAGPVGDRRSPSPPSAPG